MNLGIIIRAMHFTNRQSFKKVTCSFKLILHTRSPRYGQLPFKDLKKSFHYFPPFLLSITLPPPPPPLQYLQELGKGVLFSLYIFTFTSSLIYMYILWVLPNDECLLLLILRRSFYSTLNWWLKFQETLINHSFW